MKAIKSGCQQNLIFKLYFHRKIFQNVYFSNNGSWQGGNHFNFRKHRFCAEYFAEILIRNIL